MTKGAVAEWTISRKDFGLTVQIQDVRIQGYREKNFRK
jgi:hypothetical protein